MKGDFTRFTFDPKRHYKSVLMQQGRVVLDADWNEQAGIVEHIQETEVRDVIGGCGTPINCAGFGVDVSPDGRDLILSSGRIYVDGILCELDGDPGYFGNPAFEVSEGETLLTIMDESELDLKKEQWVEISVRIDSDRISDISPERPLIEDQVIRQALRIVKIQRDPDSNKMALTLDGKVNEELIYAAKSKGIYIKILLSIKPEQAMSNESSGTFLAYLDVWNRHITAVEDDSIREKALKGPDTSTRIKTEWGVKLIRYNPESIPRNLLRSIPEKMSCRQASLILKDLLHLAPSRLAARLHAAQEGTADHSAIDPCLALSGASYKGLENQLYRVEIHRPGGVGEATFKWSRYNGAIAFAIEDFVPDVSAEKSASNADTPAKYHQVKLSRLGWDETLRIHVEDLVEVLGDETELLGKPGTLARVMKIDEADMVLTLNEDVALHEMESNPKVRRWDMDKGKMVQSPSIEGMPTGATSGESSWIEIEKGIEVRFKEGDYYQTGDYWLIPARDSGKIEWLPDEDDFVQKFGIQHHNCLLAILSLGADGTWNLERDCRKLFSPLSDKVFLSYVGGDGQEAMPDHWLPAPFEVKVTRGELPLEGAEIAFEILEGQGVLEPAGGSVLTDGEGIARCNCQLTKSTDQDNFNIRVRARLLCDTIAGEISDQSCPWIVFNANASVAEKVAYDPLIECNQLKGASTVKEAIDGLCRQVSFSYAGGDGQEAIPGKKLSEPFRVRVARGSYPIENAVVNFRIESGKGLLESDRELATDLDIKTDQNGIATCRCILNNDLKVNARIEARLITPIPSPADQSPVIWFNASPSIAEEVAYYPLKECSQLSGASTVQKAIDDLCGQVSFTYAGGDGQECIPGTELAEPFRVRVARGSYPAVGVVNFKIDSNKGELRGEDKKGIMQTGTDLNIKTDSNGIAACYCILNKGLKENATIQAMLKTPDPPSADTAPVIWFNTDVIIAEQVAYNPEDCSQLSGASTVKEAIDGLCRLSDQVSLTYVGGDGQEAISGSVLPVPFAVRVARGSYPVKDALVGFEIVEGPGELRKEKDESGQIPQMKLEIKADENGIAECFFKLEKDVDESAVVLAKLIDPNPVDGSYIRFSVGVSSAENTGYVPSEECEKLKDATTVKQAIDILCLQSPSTEKTLTTWVHGNSLHLQIIEGNEANIKLRYDDDNCQVAIVEGGKESSVKICFSIPVVLDPNKPHPRAVEAHISAKADNDVTVDNFVISNGEKVIFSGQGITITKEWKDIRLGPAKDRPIGKEISSGIGIALNIKLKPDSKVYFGAAGCTIQSNF